MLQQKKYIINVLFLLMILSINSLSWAANAQPPINIILLIGDGMGLSQISAGKIVNGSLNMERFKSLGLVTTYSLDHLVTDSAASATAIATGYKTKNGYLSVSEQGKPLKTVLEYAQEEKKSTGIVVTSSITHATPAAFMVHIDDREKHNTIAQQIVQSQVDVLLGGGWGYFTPMTQLGSKRWDNQDLWKTLASQYHAIKSKKEFDQLHEQMPLLGLFALKHLPLAEQRKPSLAQMTDKAISLLAKNRHGFFLMVEGSQIDWGGHKNDAEYIINEVIDFDKAVGIALDFAQKNDNTLVIVTADHETGGFAIHDGSIKEKRVGKSGFTRKYHTATMVPIFSYGPNSEQLTGIFDNTKIGQLMIQFIRSH